MKSTLTPYLNFMGQTTDAMEFYKSIFGGELTMQTFKEAGFPHDAADDDLVIHAMLKNDMFVIMASDGNDEHPVHPGDSVHLSLSGSDREQLTGFFNKLSEGGKIDMPLEKQFWGDVFGMATDKFGMHWMVNIAEGEQK